MTQLPAQRATTQTASSSRRLLGAQQHFGQACQSMGEAQVCFPQHPLCTMSSVELCPCCTVHAHLTMSALTDWLFW